METEEAELLLHGGDGRNGDNESGRQGGNSDGSDNSGALIFSTLVAVCGSYVFGNSLGYSSPAESGIVDDLHLSMEEYSLFGSILTVGAMVGAVLSGRIADLIGRKGAMWVSEIFCILGWVATIFAQSAGCLDAGRLIVGIGIGILSYVVPVYIAEITPKNVRGGFTALNQLMIGIGKAVTLFTGSYVGWRVLAGIGIIPCFLHLIGLFFIPESPRWLAKVGREKEFEVALQRLRGENADISDEASDIKDYIENVQCKSKGSIKELLQRKYAYSWLVAIGLMIFQQFGGLNGFVFYMSGIFEAAGFSVSLGTVLAAIVQIMATALGVSLIDKLGRRPLLLISVAGSCLGCIFTGLAFFLQDLQSSKELISSMALLGVLLFLGSFELAMGGVPWVIMSEIFPMSVKGSAGSLVSLVSWTGSWIVSYTYNFLFEWSSAGTFLIFATVCGLGVVFIAKVVPETKGKSLEEIQKSISTLSRYPRV